jgi:hypothetical protein
MRLFYLLLFFGLFTAYPVAAQILVREVITPLGGEFQTNEFKGSFTTGQQVAALYRSESMIIIQGYQQLDLDAITEPVEGLADISNQLLAYPNPAETRVTIRSSDPQGYDLFIYGLDGSYKRAVGFLSPASELEINISDLPNGYYIIRAISTDQKSFGIIQLMKIE